MTDWNEAESRHLLILGAVERAMEECESCCGTGIEEGREYDGHKCMDCKGRGFVCVNDDSDDQVKAE